MLHTYESLPVFRLPIIGKVGTQGGGGGGVLVNGQGPTSEQGQGKGYGGGGSGYQFKSGLEGVVLVEIYKG